MIGFEGVSAAIELLADGKVNLYYLETEPGKLLGRNSSATDVIVSLSYSETSASENVAKLLL